MEVKRKSLRRLARDTFVVSGKNEASAKSGGHVVTKTSKLPNGTRVHSLDRKFFDRAVAAAMNEREKA